MAQDPVLLVCVDMARNEFPNLDPGIPVVAVDLAILTVLAGELKVLLAEVRKRPYAGMWALPGGIISADESLEQAAYRELAEKTGVRNVYLEQLYTFGDVRETKRVAPSRRYISRSSMPKASTSGRPISTPPSRGSR